MTNKLGYYKKCYGDNEVALKKLEAVFWGNTPTCPYCKSTYQTPLKDGFRYKCNNCNSSYSVLVGTIFQKTKVPLFKWFYVIDMTLSGTVKSTREIASEIETTKDTVWLMLKRIDEIIRQKRDVLELLIK